MSHSTPQQPYDPYGSGTQQTHGAQQPYGQQPAGPSFGQPPAPPRRMRNGLGTAALVLGLIGAISGLIPLLFWLGGTLGLIALILGLSGRARAKRGEADNRKVALAGALLGLVAMVAGVAGAVITFKAVDDAVDDIDKITTGQSASKEPGADSGPGGKDGADGADGKDKAKGTEKKGDSALTAGDSASYPDGLKVTTAKPQDFTPDEYAAGHAEGNKAYRITITVENTGTKKFDTALLMVEARAGAEGVTAEQIFDGSVGNGFSGTLAPGKKATATFGFSAPGDARDLTLEVTPGFDHDASQWELKL
ncbi:DUF4352 domain-containing protein [Streptomyces clavuligerus]|nr:DUF4352 domain-containing protein [Streptomyces clavuligerus]WDN52278.1 DUF4352 domain-containing protein [Streptomyces clavuligerus]